MPRERDVAPPVSIPIWSQVQPDPGPPPPERQTRAQANGARTALHVIGALLVTGGVLCAGMVFFRRQMRAAHAGEAEAMIAGIRGAEEAHRADTLAYLGCGQCEGAGCNQVQGSLLARYPHDVPNEHQWHWLQPSHSDFACWQQLGVSVDGPVRFTYAVVAGPAGVSPPAIPGLARQPAWPTPTDAWYVVTAVGDLDGDGDRSILVGSSFDSNVHVENDGE